MLNRKHMQGVTLIELMIVIVVIAIMASIAYPQYQEFTARAKRNEAKAALLQAAQNQERFFLQNNQYSTTLTDLGFNANPFTTATGSYRITLAAPTPTANFTVTATYLLGGSEAGKCATLTIDGANVKGSTPATDCWTRSR